MRCSLQKWVWVVALLQAAGGLFGCSVTMPMSESGDSVELILKPDDFEILGGARASTSQFKILFIGFGPKNSFLRAERMAADEKNADFIVSRVRVKSYEGLIIPGYWLSLLGIPDVPDWPIVANEKYIVAGTAVRYQAWHQDTKQVAWHQPYRFDILNRAEQE
jgi:hypothetical protein